MCFLSCSLNCYQSNVKISKVIWRALSHAWFLPVVITYWCTISILYVVTKTHHECWHKTLQRYIPKGTLSIGPISDRPISDNGNSVTYFIPFLVVVSHRETCLLRAACVFTLPLFVAQHLHDQLNLNADIHHRWKEKIASKFPVASQQKFWRNMVYSLVTF